MAGSTASERTSGRFPGRAPIDAYGNGGFRFAGMSHRGSILCLPQAMEAWAPRSMMDVDVASFAALFADISDIAFVLLGTGSDHEMPAPAVRAAFAELGIGLDVMATGAAARTYNVLIAEQRAFAAALLATD